MTNKRTETEKVERLQELTVLSGSLAEDWVKQAEDMGDNFLGHYDHLSHNVNYYEIVRKTWDVHTGVAFTKLYKALK